MTNAIKEKAEKTWFGGSNGARVEDDILDRLCGAVRV